MNCQKNKIYKKVEKDLYETCGWGRERPCEEISVEKCNLKAYFPKVTLIQQQQQNVYKKGAQSKMMNIIIYKCCTEMTIFF